MTVRALVVGSLVMDMAFRVPKRPQAGELVVAQEFAAFRGGKGYNQAVALARLGAQVTMVGAVGADEHGESFLRALETEGIDAGRVVRMRGTPTGVAVPLVTPDGRAAFVQYPGANRYLAPAHCVDLPDCDVLMLQGEISRATSQYAAKVIGSRGDLVMLRPTALDSASSELLSAAGVLVGNEAELGAALGEAAPGETAEGEAADGEALAEALSTPDRGAVVTLDETGAAWAAAGSSGLVSAPQVRAVDITACGASFDAALAIALAEGAGFEDAVAFACAAGAHTARIVGAEPSLPTRAQVEALLGGGAAPGG